MLFSDDGGAVWHRGAAVPTTAKVGECMLAVLGSPGHQHIGKGGHQQLVMYMRDDSYGTPHSGGRDLALSDNQGQSWRNLRIDIPSLRPSNAVQGDILGVPYPSPSSPSTALLVSDPRNNSTRTNLTISISVDRGITFRPLLNLFRGNASYSSLRLSRDGKTVFCVFDTGPEHDTTRLAAWSLYGSRVFTAAASDASHMGMQPPAVSGASRTGTPLPAAPLKADDWDTGVEVDVEEFGAVADGKTECSAAFNAALRNVSSRGGGIVHARKGGVYVVQPILLQNHTALQIAAGTFVNATTSNCPGKGFPTLVLPRPPQCGGPENTSTYPPCGTVLFAANVHDFSVRGGGSLDGGGLAFDGPPYTHPKGALMQFVMSSDAVVEDLLAVVIRALGLPGVASLRDVEAAEHTTLREDRDQRPGRGVANAQIRDGEVRALHEGEHVGA